MRRAPWLALLPLLAGLAHGEDDVRFGRDVQPLLARHCLHCHGPDGEAREADLRLDTRDGLFAEGSDGRIVVPGNPAASELIRRITSDDPDTRMPPAEAKKPLTAEQIDTLRKWVSAGAEWEGHWAFVPPQRPTPPTSKFDEVARNPVDRFVLTRLEKAGLSPSPVASRERLIRRVSLDLTGTPPTPEEVDAFLAEDSPDAYERLVDRLLASPRYGERTAIEWLDAARYADTSGYQFDGPRDMWRWRDWVVEALNANQPFDEFSTEQLAGDLLPNATLDQRIATGFNRNHRGNSEGGIVPEEFAVEYVVDRIDTTATVWLGLTLGCARCHDHKYDPVSQREYYQLFDYFNDVPEHGRAIKEGNSPPYVTAPTRLQQDRFAALADRWNVAQVNWGNVEPDAAHEWQMWEKTVDPTKLAPWTIDDGLVAAVSFDGTIENTVEDAPAAKSTGEITFTDGPRGRAGLFDGDSFVDAGDVAGFEYRDPFTVTAWVKPEESASGGVVSRMSDDVYSDGWALHVENGRVQGLFVKRWLDDSLRVEAVDPLEPGVWQHVALTYDGSRSAAGVRLFVDGEERKLRVLLDALNQSFASDEPLRIGSTGTKRRFEGAIADVRVFERVLDERVAPELQVLSVAEPIGELVRGRERTRAQAVKSFQYFLRVAGPGKYRERLANAEKATRALIEFEASLPTVMVMEQLAESRPAFVLKRGEYDKPGERVEAGVPTALSESTNRAPGRDRLGLARWLFDPRHPLTARVAVNREWQRFFGRGIVETTEDFGTQGTPPTHPELLDWLATEFVRTGWNVKRLHRLIVTSATYRQAAAVTPALLERDPANRLLARGPRFRLPAEVVRDQALAAAGLLVERVGGPSVKPYQPEGLWAEIASTKTYERSDGPDLYRRSLYSYVKRTVANPAMSVFDATTRESCLVRRTRTNTPLQSLALQNGTTYVEAARVLAQRSLALDDPADRLQWMFRRVLVRRPTNRELSILTGALDAHREHFAEHREAARELVRVGDAAVPDATDPVELAAHTAVASLILNLDEAVTP